VLSLNADPSESIPNKCCATQAARQNRGEVIKRAENYVKEYKKVRHQSAGHKIKDEETGVEGGSIGVGRCCCL